MSKRWLALLTCGLITVGGLGLLLFSGRASAGGSPKIVEIDMEARQWEYGPGIVTVNQGDLVKIHIMAMDASHGFYLDGYGINEHLEPGKPDTIQFVADKAGRWMYRCSTTCGTFHPYMIGWLRVRPNYYAGAGWVLAAGGGLGFTGHLLMLGVKKP
ncbi:MAG TPA: hypothetical protein VGK74_08480 [Symbiobacteriaceae bacterium]|jgi:cytochrome c oxidase subunit 2